MRTINIHEAKTHLSRLVDQAAKGDYDRYGSRVMGSAMAAFRRRGCYAAAFVHDGIPRQ